MAVRLHAHEANPRPKVPIVQNKAHSSSSLVSFRAVAEREEWALEVGPAAVPTLVLPLVLSCPEGSVDGDPVHP